MAWDTSRRRQGLPPDWAKRRAACLKRAGYQCEHISLRTNRRCRNEATDADHRTDPDNHDDLQALCQWHHKRKTQTEAQGARHTRYVAAKRRPQERHPGIRTPQPATRGGGTPLRRRRDDRRA